MSIDEVRSIYQSFTRWYKLKLQLYSKKGLLISL